MPALHARVPAAAAALALRRAARALRRSTSTSSSRRAGSRSTRTAREGSRRRCATCRTSCRDEPIANVTHWRQARVRASVLPLSSAGSSGSRASQVLIEAFRTLPRGRPPDRGGRDVRRRPAQRRRRASTTCASSVVCTRPSSGALYAGAVALVVPSIGYEVFGIVALEAFARGTPAIAHDLGALTEVIEDSGGGLLYRTPAELRDAMETAASATPSFAPSSASRATRHGGGCGARTHTWRGTSRRSTTPGPHGGDGGRPHVPRGRERAGPALHRAGSLPSAARLPRWRSAPRRSRSRRWRPAFVTAPCPRARSPSRSTTAARASCGRPRRCSPSEA